MRKCIMGKFKGIKMIISIEHFTPREQDVLKLLVKGLNNIEIGKILHLSPNTIKTNVSSILKKLSSKNRVAAAVRATIYKLV